MSSNYDDVVVFGSADSSVDYVRDADAMLTNGLIRKARELKIRKIDQDLLLTPSERNGFSAITKANIVLDDGREVSKIHCICGVKRGINDLERLVFESAAQSTLKAIELVEHLPASPKLVESAPVASESLPVNVTQQQKEFKHRRDKEISEKQLVTIRTMSTQRRRNPEEVALQVCGKNLKQLNSAEANDVIQAIMKKQC